MKTPIPWSNPNPAISILPNSILPAMNVGYGYAVPSSKILTPSLCSLSSQTQQSLRCVVLGAGFAGLSVIWHLLKHSPKELNLRIDLYDEVGIRGGASGLLEVFFTLIPQKKLQSWRICRKDGRFLCSQKGDAGSIAEKATNCRCSVQNPQYVVEKTEKSSLCNYGWSLMDVNEASSYCTPRPLKTLDIFPTTSTKLKEDCTTFT